MTTADLLSLNCNNCGAPLQIRASVRFVTCSHCKSQLSVQQSGGVYFTQLLERVAQQTDAMAGNLETIKLQNELERIDREWQMRQGELMSTDKHGRTHKPSPVGPIIGMVVLGIFATVVLSFPAIPPVFLVFLAAMFGMLVWKLFSESSRAAQWREAEASYQQQRAQLRADLHRLQK